METLVDLLERAATRYGERPALTVHRGLRVQIWSYRRLWQSSAEIARYLRRHVGLDPGTPVVVWAPNSPELVATFFGVMMSRLVLVPIDATATPAFVARVAAMTRAGLIVSTFPLPDDVSTRGVSLWDLPTEGGGPPIDDRPCAGDIAEIVFTSGTTGTPKGVVLTHGNITANVESALRLVPPRPLRVLSVLPLSHMLEQTVGLYVPLVLGSTIEYPMSRSASVLLKAMRRSGVTAMVLVPQALELMAHDIEREVLRQDKASQWRRGHRVAAHLPMRLRRILFRRVHRRLGGHLGLVICGGAALSAPLAETWERIGVRVVEGYGATECAPIVAANTFWDRRPGTVGRAVPGVEVGLSDAGEVLVKGPNVSPGYWEDVIATERAFDADGWYHTGDLGEWDGEGCLRLTGRLADRIVLASGLNVYPEDVERELRDESAVEDCVVLSFPDRAGHPGVHAVIIPAPHAGVTAGGDAAVAEAVRRAGTRLAPHQRATGFTVWPDDDFPRTNLLKVKRHEVEAALRAGAGAVTPAVPAAAPHDDEVLERARALLVEVGRVEAASITRGSDLTADIGLDSLGRVELAVLLEDELGLGVEDAELSELDTVAALCALIEGSRPHAPPSAFPAWPRRRPARVVRALVQDVVVFPLHRTVARPFLVQGREHLREVPGPVLLIANHTSHLDTPSILRALPRSIRARSAVAAAADYFYRSRWLGTAATLGLGTFPFSREGAVRSSLEHCGELVDDGWSVLIYPEGTRSTTGVLAPFRLGIGLLAAELGIPVVPIGVSGTHAVWPKGSRRPRHGAVTVRIGEPIHVAADTDRTKVVTELERAVAALVAPGSL